MDLPQEMSTLREQNLSTAPAFLLKGPRQGFRILRSLAYIFQVRRL